MSVIIILSACPRMITDSGFTLTVAPATANLFVGDAAQFTGTLRDKSGTTVPATLTWTTDNPSVATVDASGSLQALASGSTTVRVTAHGEVATANVIVVEDSGQTLTISPTAANLFVDATQRFTATLKDHNGNTLPATPQWSSNNANVASVDAGGLVRGATTGSATIEARVNNLVATAAVTVIARSNGVVFVGAGDIATCESNADSTTARMLDGIPGTVFVLGDNAYPNGSADDYANCYGPTWGRHKSRTRPVPGNHEYNTPGATGYFGYFGSAAGDPAKGYYSYDLGAWHIVALNSNVSTLAGSPQEVWLRADLAASKAKCTLAYWHHPRFSSGTTHGDNTAVQPLWQALYDYGAELVLTGHEHVYERFAPQTATGQLDTDKGIREFVAGTGGASVYPLGGAKPNSEVRYNSTRGLLKLILYPAGYDWQFIPTSGSFTDTGSGSCH